MPHISESIIWRIITWQNVVWEIIEWTSITTQCFPVIDWPKICFFYLRNNTIRIRIPGQFNILYIYVYHPSTRNHTYKWPETLKPSLPLGLGLGNRKMLSKNQTIPQITKQKIRKCLARMIEWKISI